LLHWVLLIPGFLLTLFINSSAFASDTLRLTIDDCIAIALEESPSARTTRLDSLYAALSWRAVRAGSYPQLSLSGEIPNLRESVDYQIVYDPETGKDEFKKISSGDENWYGRIELEQSLPWGADLSISSGLYRNTWHDDRISFGDDTTDYSLRRRFSLSQPILAGNPVGRTRAIGHLNWQSSIIDHELQVRQIIYSVKRLFFNLVSSAMALDISRQDLEQVRSSEELARRKLNAGLIPEVELLQIQVELASREGDYRQAESAVESAADRLKIELGISFDKMININWVPEEQQILKNADIDTSGERLELKRERMSLRRLELQNRGQKWSERIQAALELYYDLETRHDDLALLDRPVDKNFGLIVHFTLPIFGFGTTNSSIEQLEANLKRARVNYIYRQSQLLAELRDALRAVEQAADRIVIAEAALELSQRSYSITAERFENGQVNSRDLLDAQLDLTRTRNVLLNARIDYELSLANLELVSPN